MNGPTQLADLQRQVEKLRGYHELARVRCNTRPVQRLRLQRSPHCQYCYMRQAVFALVTTPPLSGAGGSGASLCQGCGKTGGSGCAAVPHCHEHLAGGSVIAGGARLSVSVAQERITNKLARVKTRDGMNTHVCWLFCLQWALRYKFSRYLYRCRCPAPPGWMPPTAQPPSGELT